MLKKKLESKRAELAELESAVKSGDAAAVASAKSLIAEIGEINDAIEVATKSNDILASMKGEASVPAAGAEFKTLGDAGVAAFKKAEWSHDSHGGTVRFSFKAGEVPASPVTSSTTLGGYTNDVKRPGLITKPKDELIFADLFNTEQLAGTSLTYTRELGIVGDFDVVAEGGEKPQMSAQWDTKTVTIEKLAGIYKMTDEFLDDAPLFVQNMNDNFNYKMRAKEEARLVSTLLNDADIQSYEYDDSKDNALIEAIFHAVTLIKVNAARNANAIVLNPLDYEIVRLTKDGNAQYYGGGVFAGQYGNGGLAYAQPIWGIPTYVSNSVSQGTVLVGDFTGASVLRHGGVNVAMTDSDGDDFSHDIITVRMEERIALAVYYPKAFCVVNPQ